MISDLTAERYATVLRLRREGLTFAEIGQAIGTGGNRANQLYNAAQKWEARLARWSDAEPTLETPIAQLRLSDRTFDCLRKGGLTTFSDAIDLLQAEPAQALRLPNFGRIEVEELQALIAQFRRRSSEEAEQAEQAASPAFPEAQSARRVLFGEEEWTRHAALVGGVTLAWNKAIYQLLQVFIHLTGVEAPVANAIFFSFQSDSAQRRMVRQVAGVVGISCGDYNTLEALLKRIEKVSRGRNLAAHVIFGISQYDPDTGIWGARVVPAIDPPQDSKLQGDFAAQFKKVETELGKIFQGLENWLINTPYPARPWGGPPLPVAAARDAQRARAQADHDQEHFSHPWPEA